MAKKVARILPRSMKPIGDKLAEIHCNNLGLKAGSKKYENEFQKYIFEFNDEAYGLSMTPSGLIGQNPHHVKIDDRDQVQHEHGAKLTKDVYAVKSVGLYFDKNKIDEIVRRSDELDQISPNISFIDKNIHLSDDEISKTDLTLPIVFGTHSQNGKKHNFIIIGNAQMVKAVKIGIPVVDAIVLDKFETMRLIRPTKNTLKNLKDFNT